MFDPRGGAWMEGRYVPSLLAAIGDVIERHMIEIGFLPPKRTERGAMPGCQPAAPTAGVRRPARAPAAMPEMRRGGADPQRRLRPVHRCDYSKCGWAPSRFPSPVVMLEVYFTPHQPAVQPPILNPLDHRIIFRMESMQEGRHHALNIDLGSGERRIAIEAIATLGPASGAGSQKL